MKKHQLLGILEATRGFDPERAKPWLEQYVTDAMAAVELGFVAGFMHDDLAGRLVIDLGTGTGRLALVAFFFGASTVVGIDIDPGAIEIARSNLAEHGFQDRVHLVNCDALQLPVFARKDAIPRNFPGATLLMNPPFGVQKRGADVRFLGAATSIPGVDVIYSFHLSNQDNRAFLSRKIKGMGWKIDELRQTTMVLPRTYRFHQLVRKEIPVDIYRLVPG